MSYPTGQMRARVTIAKRVATGNRQFGSGGEQFQVLGDYWAWEKWNKGTKSLREGALDAYDVVMFRMYYHAEIDRWCLVKYQGRWYQILSFNADYHTNEIQITAQELANQQVRLVEYPSCNEIDGGSDNQEEIGT